jgi:hypothetical protein
MEMEKDLIEDNESMIEKKAFQIGGNDNKL